MKIVYSDWTFGYASYYMLSQFIAKLLDGSKGVGSCSEVTRKGKGRHMLTCAHNLADYSSRTKTGTAYTEPHI